MRAERWCGDFHDLRHQTDLLSERPSTLAFRSLPDAVLQGYGLSPLPPSVKPEIRASKHFLYSARGDILVASPFYHDSGKASRQIQGLGCVSKKLYL